MRVYLGVDIGGTFTDVVGVDEDGRVKATKTSSTPPRFEEGFLEGVGKLAGLYGMSTEELLGSTEIVLHGTTVATNAVVELRGSRVGVITTKGHADTLPLMRAAGRTKGLPLEAMLHASRTNKPEPLVEPALIAEVDERIDARGEVVVALDESGVEQRTRELAEQGAEAIAVSFLWSVKNPDHERRAAEAVRRAAPDLYVTCSHDVSGRSGEYERFAAAAINAFVGPEASGYMRRLEEGLRSRGLRSGLLIMQAAGGVTPASEAGELAARTIGSGPAAGVAASAVLGSRRKEPEVITTDMGGTSFDVGLIADGDVARASSTIVNQYEFFLPRTDVRSIGSGGGSIIWYDEGRGALRVGPESAGADPGPACYGRGGERPTVTDANLVLGYLDPDYFLGGEIRLDRAQAERVLEEVGRPLGIGAVEVAASAKRIVDSQMADLIRQMTVQRGLDPRDFVVYAYGGAAGMHVAGYIEELGGLRAVVPLGALSATWSAFGCASADIVHVHEHAELLQSPFDGSRLQDIFGGLERDAREQLEGEGIPRDRQVLERLVEMKYPLQIHQVEVEIPEEEVTGELASGLPERFKSRYEELFGRGAAFEGAGTQVVLCRVTGRGLLPQPQVFPEDMATAPAQELAGSGSRPVMWLKDEGSEELDTTVFRSEQIQGGGTIAGPAIVEGATTTIAVPPGHRGAADAAGNLVLEAG